MTRFPFGTVLRHERDGYYAIKAGYEDHCAGFGCCATAQ
jgi:hypothetical protein